MSTLFTNTSRSGWWDIGSSIAYMYAKIDATLEYGRLYESSVEFTFDTTISPKGTNVYYSYPIYYDIYLNNEKKYSQQLKGMTGTSIITHNEYHNAISLNIDNLSASTTSAPWKIVFRSDSGYSCEASGTLTFPAYESGNDYQYPVYRFQASNLPPDAFPIEVTLESYPSCSFTLDGVDDYHTQEITDFYYVL